MLDVVGAKFASKRGSVFRIRVCCCSCAPLPRWCLSVIFLIFLSFFQLSIFRDFVRFPFFAATRYLVQALASGFTLPTSSSAIWLVLWVYGIPHFQWPSKLLFSL